MKIKLLLAGLFFLVTMSCKINSGKNSNPGNDTTAIDSSEINPWAGFKKDSIHDNVARLLSGIEQYMHDTGHLVPSAKWSSYSNSISSSWRLIEEKRLTKMEKWEDDYFGNQLNDTMLLFYPFSGPDFLHAYYLYPNANDYIFLANEKIGDVPDFSTMTANEIHEYLQNVNYFLRDIYKRSYFITGNMIKDIHHTSVKGIQAIFYVFLARTGHEIFDMERLKLSTDGKIMVKPDSVQYNENEYNGIRFYIRKQGEKRIKTLSYFYVDISDKGFESNPEVGLYLESLRPCNTFVKSASYLMHYKTFSRIRNITLHKSQTIFQDDTGIAFRYFKPDTWNITLFGAYEKPIKDFGDYLYQADLATAYSDTSYSVHSVPFSLGYHWSSGVQNQMLAKKK